MKHKKSLSYIFLATFLVALTLVAEWFAEDDGLSISVPTDATVSTGKWIVDADQAKKMIDDGALVIDARAIPQKLKITSPQGSVPLLWHNLSRTAMSEKGIPLSFEEGTRKLSLLGVSHSRPVVVLGDWENGWGEDGRVVWSLRRWGHANAVMINGGLSALKKAGIPVMINNQVPTQFIGKDAPALQATIQEVKHKIGKPGVVLLDVRETREYAGQTPYGEGRGGHLPGATNVWFKSFLKSDGYLKSREEITRLLLEHGITDKNEIIVYCSGGFRSAWVMSVLNDYGYQVKNYAGSMWQWSDRNFLRFPLVVATHRP